MKNSESNTVRRLKETSYKYNVPITMNGYAFIATL